MNFIEKDVSPDSFSPLVLAYIGDSVYDLYVRTKLIENQNAKVRALHTRATQMVNAVAQCETVHAIMDKLSEEEITVYKRGRNANALHAPKKSEILEYRHATGLETLIGYLYIKKDTARLNEILALCYEEASKNKNNMSQKKSAIHENEEEKS